MQPVSALVVFVIIWWSVIFCVLPIGQATHYEEPEEGEDYTYPGSPNKLNMKKKLIITTVISIILWVITYIIIESEIIDLREIAYAEL
ncbi:MAG: DUF1467 family protein [Alphaproteobacteria bacterium]|nr:DUF1467 family protein [Alphaproteobacteria bacterium]